ncbi:hypothetical protein PO590_13630 [Raoultella ornithinolytica]|uniref:hypothetical protein n=1 Tax=Raoultella ornithinolytica TaxID=54291 RepID=UPI002FF7E812
MKMASIRVSAFILALVLSGCSQSQINPLWQLAGIQDPVSPAQQQPASAPEVRNSVAKTWTLPVDVDTAALRLKQHYSFSSDEDVAAARNSGQGNAGWSASAISEGASWVAQSGSYYRMSRNWAGNDRLTLEVRGNRQKSSITATYISSSPEHLKKAWTARLWQQIPNVARGNPDAARDGE